jgi:hypothetical protein
MVGVIGGWMGTSLFYYSSVFTFMAHPMSFALLAGVLALSRKLWDDGATHRTLVLLGLCLAALFLVRPQQTVVGVFLLPLLVRGIRGRAPRRWLAGAAAGAASVLAALAIEAFVKRAQFGVARLDGHDIDPAGFQWFSWSALEVVLVGARHGLLRYSPVVAIAALGYLLFPRSIPRHAWPSVANALAQLYLIAALLGGVQSDSFGLRMWSDNAAVAAIGVAALWRGAPAAGRPVVAVSLAICVAWTMVLLARYIELIG